MAGDILTRRRLCAGLAAFTVAGGPARSTEFCRDEAGWPASGATVLDPLGTINPRLAWGVAMAAPALYDARLVTALRREAPNFLAIASGLKFGNLYPTRPRPTGDPDTITGSWGECDDVVALASRLAIPVRGDCLAWNDWLPPWLIDLARERPAGWRDQAQHLFDGHFAAVFDHLATLEGRAGPVDLRWCGVVNEPFNPWTTQDGVPEWRPGPWLDTFGSGRDGVPAYIGRAFDFAARHRRSGSTALFLNEVFCDSDRFGPALRPAMLRLVDALQRSGRTVDAIGLECHLMPQWMNDRGAPDWTPFVAFLKDLSRRGVKVFLTELDVNDCSVREGAARDALVARYTYSLVRAALEVPAVEMVTNWDFSDGFSWLREDTTSSSTYPGLGKWASCVPNPPCPRPDIYDQAMQPKDARASLARAFAEAPR